MGKGEGDWLGGDIFEARLCILGPIPVAIPVGFRWRRAAGWAPGSIGFA